MSKPKDYNWMKENLETKVVDGQTWIRLMDRVYDAIRY